LTAVEEARTHRANMMVVLLAAGAIAVGLAIWRLATRLREAERQVRELRLVRREVDELRGELERGLAVTRAHLTDVMAGEPPARDVVLRGAAYRDVEPDEALALYEQRADLVVLDVRTPAEHANGHIPNSRLVPLDELEDRLADLPARDALVLVHCAAGGRSTTACQILARQGWLRLLNLRGGMHTWSGPRARDESLPPPAPPAPAGTAISYRGGPVGQEQVIAAIRECYDPEIPLNVYDLGLIYGVDIDESAIAVRMTLTSEGCPAARTIPEDVRNRIAALGQPNVTVDVVWDPPWHPSRISEDGKQKLGLV
jgi:metal-sulfur cluster biosynthetic enzyme/rhodanese-related sulfurtransferase